MITDDEFKAALSAAVKAAGGQTALARQLGMTQSQISDYLHGRFSVEKMTVGNLCRLLPGTQIRLAHGVEDNLRRSMRERLLELYEALDEESQVECLTLVAQRQGKNKAMETAKDKADIA